MVPIRLLLFPLKMEENFKNVCLCLDVFVCIYLWRPDNLRFHSQEHHPPLWKQVLSQSWHPSSILNLLASVPQGSVCPSPPSISMTSEPHCAPHAYMGSGDQTQVPKLVWQTLAGWDLFLIS